MDRAERGTQQVQYAELLNSGRDLYHQQHAIEALTVERRTSGWFPRAK